MKRYLRYLKPVVAEGVGTYFLALTIGLAFLSTQVSAMYQALFTPFAAGLVIVVLYLMFAPISGGHFNPAVTLAMFSNRKAGLLRTVLYLLIQVGGAMLAALSVKYFFGIMPYKPDYVDVKNGFFAEMAGALLLGLAYGAAELGTVPESAKSFLVGIGYALALTLSAVISTGIVNPAVAIVWRGNGMVYGVAPMAGVLVGYWLMVWLYPKKAAEVAE